MKRIIVISGEGARIRISNGCLSVKKFADSEPVLVPLGDLLTVVVCADAVTLTHAVLSELARFGVPYVSCDRFYMPVGLSLPVSGNSLQGERFWKQKEFRDERSLWHAVLKGKFENTASIQGWLGIQSGRRDELFASFLAGGIEPEEAEAQIARDHFSSLFETGFTRRDRGYFENSRLNFGYTILRSTVARYVVGSGLHPTFGIHHRNRYNAYALVDDLMEPFRPCIDYIVVSLLYSGEIEDELASEEKRFLAEAFFQRWESSREGRTLASWIEKYIRACSQFILGAREDPPQAPVFSKPPNLDIYLE